MNALFQENDVVRVVKFLAPIRDFSGTEAVMRSPQIGDQAVICAMCNPHDPKSPLILEMVHQDGGTIWLADFLPEEIELVSRPRQ